MEQVSEESSIQKKRFWDRLLPLRYWFGADAAGGLEVGQAKTRLICTFVGLCGLGIIGTFTRVPVSIAATGVAFLLYAIAYLVLV